MSASISGIYSDTAMLSFGCQTKNAFPSCRPSVTVSMRLAYDVMFPLDLGN